MQDLVPWPGIESRLPELGAQSLYLTRPPGKSHRQRDLWKSRSDHITAPASCCSTKALQWLSVSPTVAQRSDLIWPLPVSLISSLSTLLVIPELQPHSPFFPFKQTKLNPASGPLHLLFPQLESFLQTETRLAYFCQPGQGSFHLWFSQIKAFQIGAAPCPSH